MSASGERKSCSSQLEIKLFGRFEVFRNGDLIPEEAWGRRKTKTLLKILLTDPGRVFTNDQLIEFLFEGENVQGALENLYGRVSQLRRALEPELKRGVDSAFILRHEQTYCFNPDSSTQIDMVDFQQGLQSAFGLADAQEWMGAVEQFDDVLALYRGEFLAEDLYEEWAEARRGELRDMHLKGLTRLADCYEHLGRLRQAISCCQRILGIEPYRESVIRQLMEYQHEAGQRAQALDTYNEGERALREYLDVDPSPETRALHQRIVSSEAKKETRLDPRRIAVLPFANYSLGPEDDYLADGITEELIGHLSRLRDLRVVARTSVMRFKDTTQSIARIARELHVGTLLEGSVRKADKSIRISTQLINAGTEEHLWASEYSGPTSDLLAFQQDVARKVAESLDVVLFRDEAQQSERRPPEASEAYSIYLRGRFFMAKATGAGSHKALACFQEAIALDPQLAAAHVGVARYYQDLAGWEDVAGNRLVLSEGYAKARLALLKALEIDPKSADAHAALGLIQAFYEHRFSDAETTYKRAIHLNPSNPAAHSLYCTLLICMNRIDEALAEARCVLDLGPVSLRAHSTIAFALIAARRLDDALRVIDQGIEMDPSFRHLYGHQATMHWLLWNWEDAKLALERFVSAGSHPVNGPWHRGLHALYLGRISDSLAEFRRMESFGMGDRRLRLAFALALYHAREYEQVIALMEGLLDADSFGIPYAGKSWLRLLRALALERLGNDKEAASALQEARDGLPEWVYATFSRGPILADVAEFLIQIRRGQEEGPLRTIQRLTVRSKENEVASALAVLHFHLQKIDEGFHWLETALDHHDEFLLTIKTHPWFDVVRKDSRFRSILERMNLAD